MNAQRDTVAIIGANGQVGTEISILLKEQGKTVYPVVRNRIGASTFETHDFEYRIGEIVDEADAPTLLEDAQTIVITAFVPWFYAMNPKSARKTNKNIVENAVKYAGEETTIIYFSTLVAFGSDVGLSDWNWYCREKRRTEKDFSAFCKQYGKDGYVFRLGHVYGPTQNHTREFIDNVVGHDQIHFPVSKTKKSNIVHSSVVVEAIEKCASGKVDPGTYTVVNQPQWSWKDVIDHYAPHSRVRFDPTFEIEDSNSGVVKRTAGSMIRIFKPYKDVLISPLHYVPDSISSYLNRTRNSEEVTDSVRNYRDRVVYDHPHLQYKSVSGPYLSGSLKNIEKNEDVLVDNLLR